MPLRFGAKVAFVVPLDLGHVEQVRDEVPVARENGEASGIFVLANVPTLESPRSVHRDEPPANTA